MLSPAEANTTTGERTARMLKAAPGPALISPRAKRSPMNRFSAIQWISSRFIR